MITKINKDEDGKIIEGVTYYWTLYVEGKYSQKGISNFNITDQVKNILWSL
jgi:hypothetical protein